MEAESGSVKTAGAQQRGLAHLPPSQPSEEQTPPHLPVWIPAGFQGAGSLCRRVYFQDLNAVMFWRREGSGSNTFLLCLKCEIFSMGVMLWLLSDKWSICF